jgi:hypothetical protein
MGYIIDLLIKIMIMKNLGLTKMEKLNRARSWKISFALHGVLFLLGMIPLVTSVSEKQEHVFDQVVNIQFAEFANNSDEGLKAKSPVPDAEKKPVVEADHEIPDVVEAEEIVEETKVTETIEDLESDIVEEVEQDVVAAEDEMEAEDMETSSVGGSESTLEEGESEGLDDHGENEGLDGLGGDGIITRKIIYREDISKAAVESGTIVIDLCINRKGRVLEVAKNADLTTIRNSDMVRHALYIASDYRFEPDYTAANRECGKLTFIFNVEGMMADDIRWTD